MSGLVLFLDVLFLAGLAGAIIYTIKNVKVVPNKHSEEFSIRKLNKLLRKRS